MFRTWRVIVEPSERKRKREGDVQVATLVVAAPIDGRGPSANFEITLVGTGEHDISVRHSSS